MFKQLLLIAIGCTVAMVIANAIIILYTAYGLGGDFYIFQNYGRRKKFLEKILDGLEIVLKF